MAENLNPPQGIPHDGLFQVVVSTTKKLEEFAKEQMRRGKEKTVATKEYDDSPDATKFTKKVDPKNGGGTVPIGLDIATAMKKLAGKPEQLVQDIMGGNVMEMLQQYTKALQQGIPGLSQIEQQLQEMFQKLGDEAPAEETQSAEDIIALMKELSDKIKKGIS